MLISWLTRTGTVEVATKYAGYFYCYSYGEILDLSLSFTLIIFMLQLSKANTGDEIILRVKVKFRLYMLFSLR